jgi:hypothetical protein
MHETSRFVYMNVQYVLVPVPIFSVDIQGAVLTKV